MKLSIPFRPAIAAFRYRWYRRREMAREMGCSPYRRLVIFDVGANDGSSFAEFIALFPWCRIYGFEPTPELITKLRTRFAGKSHYHLVPKAVGEVAGKVTFNIAGQEDWGCSSVLEFSKDLDRTWPGRTDFKVTQRIEVDMIRLDDFVRENRIAQIDFLHVDTQGTDLSVLRSLGNEIHRVRSGVIEVPQSTEVMLYQNQHTREEALNFLREHGFEVWKTVSQQNEDNLYFRRIAR